MKLLHELLELPGQALGALVTFGASVLGIATTLVAQALPLGAEMVSSAPSWFLAFVALCFLGMVTAIVSMARFIVKTQKDFNGQVVAELSQHRTATTDQTRVLKEMKDAITEQAHWFRNVGVEAVQSAMRDAEIPLDLSPSPGPALSTRAFRAPGASSLKDH